MQIFSHTSQLACPRSVTDAAGREPGGRRDRDGEHHLVRVAEAHRRADGDAMRMRPGDGPGAEPRRELPVDRHRLAGVARIDPVGVPARVDALAHAHPEGGAGRDRADLADEVDADARLEGAGGAAARAPGLRQQGERERDPGEERARRAAARAVAARTGDRTRSTCPHCATAAASPPTAGGVDRRRDPPDEGARLPSPGGPRYSEPSWMRARDHDGLRCSSPLPAPVRTPSCRRLGHAPRRAEATGFASWLRWPC